MHYHCATPAEETCCRRQSDGANTLGTGSEERTRDLPLIERLLYH